MNNHVRSATLFAHSWKQSTYTNTVKHLVKPTVSKGPKVNRINPELFFIPCGVFVMDFELLHSYNWGNTSLSFEEEAGNP